MNIFFRISAHIRPTTSLTLTKSETTACQSFTVVRNYSAGTTSKYPKILITGGLGQLGVNFSRVLRKKYGKENVLLSDIVRPSKEILQEGPYCFADVLDFRSLQRVVVDNNIDWLIHFSALVSAVAEQNTGLAMRVNVEGVHNALEIAKQYHCRLFIPSTIGAFGPTSPRVNTPNVTIMRPTTIYGVSKIHAELLGEYYQKRYNVDFRCLRLPGIISAEGAPGGGTTDYAVHIFYEVLKHKKYNCYLRADTRMPMMYLDDVLRGIRLFMELPEEQLKQRTYNLAAISFTPEEIAEELQKQLQMDSLTITYNPDFRQAIADSWPQSLDDSSARKDWNWNHEYDLEKLVSVMIQRSKSQI